MNWDHLDINVNGEKLNHLQFADDIAIVSDNSMVHVNDSR